MRRSRSCRLAVLPTVALAVLLSACAQTQHSYQAQSYAGAYAAPEQVAVVRSPPVIMEDDGMPAQQPPRMRKGAAPDDPSEPFSPNYGPPLQSHPTAKPSREARTTYVPHKRIDADYIIARAITEHEMRAQ